MTGTAPDRIALFAAVLALIAGYVGLFRPYEAAIAERYAQFDDGRVLLDGRPERARRERALLAEERSLSLRLAASGMLADRTAMVGHFVRALTRTARADDIGVTHFAIDDTTPSFAMHGTYPQLIRFVRDLAATGIAARIDVETLGNADPRVTTAPELFATCRVTLLRAAPLTDGSHATI
jgi:hypothetical protein